MSYDLNAEAANARIDALDRDAVYRKIAWRTLPFLLLCYVFAYLDRINIGFAKLQMQQDIGMSDAVFGLAAGVFFVGYVMFEIPSNLLMARIGARKTLSRIMVLWGLTSAATLLVKQPTAFYVMRFLLGVFEAGFAPGIIFYCTLWFPRARMAGPLAILLLNAPICGVMGGPLSAVLMTHFDGAAGMRGWQWMFLIEGLACVVLGVIAFFTLTDFPRDARWLSRDEKALVAAEVNHGEAKHASFRSVLKDPRIFVLGFVLFGVICGLYTVSFWLPTMLKENGVTDIVHIGLLSAIPYITAIIASVAVARSSDRMLERRWHFVVPAFLAAVALTASTFLGHHLAIYVICMSVAAAMVNTSLCQFWAIPSLYLRGEAAAGGVALINTLGLVGGFTSPIVVGWARTLFGSLSAGLYVMALLLALGGAIIAIMKLPGKKAF